MPGNRPEVLRIRQWDGAPDFWLGLNGPGGTGAGDVAEIEGRYAAGVRSGNCTWGMGQAGRCLAFDGVSGDVQVKIPDLTGKPWAVAFRLALDPTNTNSVIPLTFGASASGGNNCHFIFDQTSITFGFYGVNNLYVSRTWGSTPHMIHAGIDAFRNQFLYIDGILVAAASIGSFYNGTNDLFLGRWVQGGYQFKGTLDIVKFWARDLAHQEPVVDFDDPWWRLRRIRRPRYAAQATPTFRPYLVRSSPVIGSGVY